MDENKPLNWSPQPGLGYAVTRRPDGGLTVTFHDLSDQTLADWREFAFAHLLDSDRLTRNLYDLRELSEIPEKAIKVAVEVNSDPSTRNLRVGVLVAGESAHQAVARVASGVAGGGAAIRIFTSIEEAEAWLKKPLDQII
jgi:hypothetical protein